MRRDDVTAASKSKGHVPALRSVLTTIRYDANRLYGRHAPGRVQARFGGVIPDSIDLGAVERIRTAPLDQLMDTGWLEHELLPQLGMHDSMRHIFPSELQARLGTGLRVWQWPNQLAPYLTTVGRYPVRHYLEIGVLHGGMFVTTVEYLRRFCDLRTATAVDVQRALAVMRYGGQARGIRFLRTTSISPLFRAFIRLSSRVDLVLIDGDHSELWCRRDFEAVRDHANMIAFHDVADTGSPGVVEVWQRFKATGGDTFEFHEFTQQYPEVLEGQGSPWLGLGLAIRRDWAAAA